MKRKVLIYIVSLSTLIGALVFFTTVPIEDAAEGKPNIVFIMADDLGYAGLGSYGQKRIRTPNLDQFAEQGIRFTQHYSGSTVCAPSRYVLLTGKHPGHAWIRGNKRSTNPVGNEPILAEEITIAELLKDQGYATGIFGKWGLGAPNSSGDPMSQGFDIFFGYHDQRRAHSYYPAYLQDNNKHFPLNNHPPVPGHSRLPKEADPLDPSSYDMYKGTDYAPDRINERALSFIRENKNRPFFLYYPTIIPHLALHVPDDDLTPYLKLGWDDTPSTKRYTPHLTPKAAYAAMITRMDHYVGRLLSLLDELNLTDNTIVVFTSDNGAEDLTKDKEVDLNFFELVGPLRGLKGSLYEGGIRVPAIVRWPGKVKAGSITNYVSGSEDWLPTIMEAVTTEYIVSTSVDGISLLPTLLGREQEERPFLYREFPNYGGQQSVRVGDWKAVRQGMNKGNLGIELYNLARDIGEKENVAAQNPEVVKRLREIMEQQHRPSEIFPLPSVDKPATRP